MLFRSLTLECKSADDAKEHIHGVGILSVICSLYIAR